MSKNQFTGTAMQPQRNRKFCQFNNDQYTVGHCENTSLSRSRIRHEDSRKSSNTERKAELIRTRFIRIRDFLKFIS